MKYVMLFAAIALSACATAEQDFANHQAYLESIYNLDNYDPEYVDDCLYYEEIVCEFE